MPTARQPASSKRQRKPRASTGMQLVPTGRPRPYSGACRTIPPDTRPRRPDASTDRAACASRAAADHAATLAGRQRQSCAIAGRAPAPTARLATAGRRRPHSDACRTPAPIVRHRRPDDSTGSTATPVAPQRTSHGSTGARRHQLVGSTNRAGKHIRAGFPPRPIIRRQNEGSFIKMCGV